MCLSTEVNLTLAGRWRGRSLDTQSFGPGPVLSASVADGEVEVLDTQSFGPGSVLSASVADGEVEVLDTQKAGQSQGGIPIIFHV